MEKVLTLILLTCSGASWLDRALEALKAPELPEGLEILVADTGPEEKARELVSGYCRCYPGTVDLVIAEKGNPGGAVTTALNRAKGAYCWVLPGQTLADFRDLSLLLEVLRRDSWDAVVIGFRSGDRILLPGILTAAETWTPGQLGESWGHLKPFLIPPCVIFRRGYCQGLVLPGRNRHWDREYLIRGLCCACSVGILNLAPMTLREPCPAEILPASLEEGLLVCSRIAELPACLPVLAAGGRMELYSRLLGAFCLSLSLCAMGLPGGQEERVRRVLLNDHPALLRKLRPRLFLLKLCSIQRIPRSWCRLLLSGY